MTYHRRIALWHTAAGAEPRTAVGNANYTIKAWDRVVATTTAFTAPRTWTMPLASSVAPGQGIWVVDEFGAISETNFLQVNRAGTDTLNGQNTVQLHENFGRLHFISNGVDKWSYDRHSTSNFNYGLDVQGPLVGIDVTDFILNTVGGDISISAFGGGIFLSGAVAIGGSVNLAGALDVSSSLRTSSSSSPLGYSTGAGASVTQLTNKSTAVTINTPTGRITTDNAALAAGASVTFTVNNNTVTGLDTVLINLRTQLASYTVRAGNQGAGTFDVVLTNTTAGSRSDAILLSFAVIKGAIS